MDTQKTASLIEIPPYIWDRPFYRGVRTFFSLFCRTYLRISVVGQEHIPETGGVIIASNHQSALDVPLMSLAIPREARFPGKAELFQSALIRTFLLSLGGFPLVRGEGDKKAISFSQTVIERGDILVLFPEGTRSRDKSILPFHRGLGLMSIKTGAPIIPSILVGSGNVMGVGARFPRPGKIRIEFSTPIYPPKAPTTAPEIKKLSHELALATEQAVRALYEKRRDS
ncbi:MAG: lysophospholipid acyltransferase family protein [Leptospirales bacterium]